MKSLTSAELEGLRQAHEVFDFLKKYAAGFEHAVFLDTADMVGIRESRHIKGKYWMTGEDALAVGFRRIQLRSWPQIWILITKIILVAALLRSRTDHILEFHIVACCHRE